MKLVDLYNSDVAEAIFLYVTDAGRYSEYEAIKKRDNISMAQYVQKYKHADFSKWFYATFERVANDSTPINMACESVAKHEKCVLYIPFQMELKPILYSFEDVVNAPDNIFDYQQFCYIKSLCQHDVDLWECVHINVQGINLTMLVDEEGKLKNLPRSFPASALYSNPFDDICGDVFIVSQQADELMYLKEYEIKSLGQYFGFKPPYFEVIHI